MQIALVQEPRSRPEPLCTQESKSPLPCPLAQTAATFPQPPSFKSRLWDRNWICTLGWHRVLHGMKSLGCTVPSGEHHVPWCPHAGNWLCECFGNWNTGIYSRINPLSKAESNLSNSHQTRNWILELWTCATVETSRNFKLVASHYLWIRTWCWTEEEQRESWHTRGLWLLRVTNVFVHVM